MCKEQLDEHKEGVFVCEFGDVYSRYEISYDAETGKWFQHEYHYGVIDIDDERDYGVSEVDKKYVIRKLVDEEELRQLIRYYKELDAEPIMPDILKRLQGHIGAYPHINGTGFLETPRYIYYLFQNDDYAICTENRFYSMSLNGSWHLDYSVINRIIEEKDTVLRYQYDYLDKMWKAYPFQREQR